MPDPYGYVRIPTDEDGTPLSVLDDPVFHDGAASASLVSGELRCTLTALTPLIAGNNQFEARIVAGRDILDNGTVKLPDSWNLPCAVAAEKKIIEPLRDAQGRVLMGGAAITGMMMASISTLLAAPMACVDDLGFGPRYKDVVRKKWRTEDRVATPHPEEQRLLGNEDEKHQQPAKLSAARLLSGYAMDSRNPGMKDIGQGDFEQLAGRVAVNTAVESTGGAEPEDRFMSKRSNFSIPLKVLGAPNAVVRRKLLDSSSEGDGPYRKSGHVFYRHQPDAARHFFWRGTHDDQGNIDKRNIGSNQSCIVRFVLKPKRQLRVRIRFRDLRHWELGAVMASLRPTLVEDDSAALTEPDEFMPRHAVKLGHGRPLGLGSVRVDIDRLLTLRTLLSHQPDPPSEESLAREAVAAFHARMGDLDGQVRADWLDLHRFSGAAGRASYAGPP